MCEEKRERTRGNAQAGHTARAIVCETYRGSCHVKGCDANADLVRFACGCQPYKVRALHRPRLCGGRCGCIFRTARPGKCELAIPARRVVNADRPRVLRTPRRGHQQALLIRREAPCVSPVRNESEGTRSNVPWRMECGVQGTDDRITHLEIRPDCPGLSDFRTCLSLFVQSSPPRSLAKHWCSKALSSARSCVSDHDLSATAFSSWCCGYLAPRTDTT